MAKLLANARQRAILDLINKHGHMRVITLAETFKVSDETIRNDFRVLLKQNLVRKLHGGAEALSTPSLNNGLEDLPKGAFDLAQEALAYIKPNSALFVDAHPALTLLASDLPAVPLTVYTASLPVMLALQDREEIELVCLGGTYNAQSRSFFAEGENPLVENVRFDLGIFVAQEVDADLGCLVSHKDYARNLRPLLKRCRQKLCLNPGGNAESARYSVASLDETLTVLG